MLKREFPSSSIDTSRLEDLEQKCDAMNRHIAGLEIEVANMHARLNATSTWFENRVDLIYRRVCLDLQAYLGAAHLDTIHEIEIDTHLTRLISGGLSGDPDGKALLREMLDGELRPGRLDGPLTLRGFRLHRQFARETGNHIAIKGGANAIVVYGPYKKLKPGSYRLRAIFAGDVGSPAFETERPGTIELDVYCSSLDTVVARQRNIGNGGAGEFAVEIEFEWSFEAARGTVEFRIHQHGDLPVKLLRFDLETNRQPIENTNEIACEMKRSHAL